MGGNDNAERTVELLVTDTEARLRDAVREMMLARTAYWYNAVTAPDDLREQIEQEVAEADAEYQSALDALIRYVRAEARREMPCYQTFRGAIYSCTIWNSFDVLAGLNEHYQTVELCPACAAEAELDALKEAK